MLSWSVAGLRGLPSRRGFAQGGVQRAGSVRGPGEEKRSITEHAHFGIKSSGIFKGLRGVWGRGRLVLAWVFWGGLLGDLESPGKVRGVGAWLPDGLGRGKAPRAMIGTMTTRGYGVY